MLVFLVLLFCIKLNDVFISENCELLLDCWFFLGSHSKLMQSSVDIFHHLEQVKSE